MIDKIKVYKTGVTDMPEKTDLEGLQVLDLLYLTEGDVFSISVPVLRLFVMKYLPQSDVIDVILEVSLLQLDGLIILSKTDEGRVAVIQPTLKLINRYNGTMVSE